MRASGHCKLPPGQLSDKRIKAEGSTCRLDSSPVQRQADHPAPPSARRRPPGGGVVGTLASRLIQGTRDLTLYKYKPFTSSGRLFDVQLSLECLEETAHVHCPAGHLKLSVPRCGGRISLTFKAQTTAIPPLETPTPAPHFWVEAHHGPQTDFTGLYGLRTKGWEGCLKTGSLRLKPK